MGPCHSRVLTASATFTGSVGPSVGQPPAEVIIGVQKNSFWLLRNTLNWAKMMALVTAAAPWLSHLCVLYSLQGCTGNQSKFKLNLNTAEACVLSPLLLTPFTHDCTPICCIISQSLLMMPQLLTWSLRRMRHYKRELDWLVVWCKNDGPVLNTSKTKELYFRRSKVMEHLHSTYREKPLRW